MILWVTCQFLVLSHHSWEYGRRPSAFAITTTQRTIPTNNETITIERVQPNVKWMTWLPKAKYSNHKSCIVNLSWKVCWQGNDPASTWCSEPDLLNLLYLTSRMILLFLSICQNGFCCVFQCKNDCVGSKNLPLDFATILVESHREGIKWLSRV